MQLKTLSLLTAALLLLAVPVSTQRVDGGVRVNGFQQTSSWKICNTSNGTCGCTAYTDAATINQWNVITCTLPAATLAQLGDQIEVVVNTKAAANGDSKTYQLYWNGGTCSGTGATCCSTGTQIYSDGGTDNAVAIQSRDVIERLASNSQKITGSTLVGASSVKSIDGTTAAVTDTGSIPIAFCARDTSAGSATLQGTPTMNVFFAPGR